MHCATTLPPDALDGLRGEMRMDEPMSRHTSWRTGGVADYFFVPRDREDLLHLLARLPGQVPVTCIGLGSNLLVRDGGVRGVVIDTSRGLKGIEVHAAGRLYAESGVSCARLARRASDNHLSGIEFLAGVPGSVGGALAMNAGAFGGEIWNRVHSVEYADRSGICREIPVTEVVYGYRSVQLPPESCILSAVISLQRTDDTYDGRSKIRDLLKRRKASQPIQSASAGSVFRNPEGDFAARLIEQCGLKGFSVGDAAVSDVHANFIINNNGATAAQIETLIRMIIEKVRDGTGITLVPEVRIMGEYS